MTKLILKKGKDIRPIGFITPGGYQKTAKGWRKVAGGTQIVAKVPETPPIVDEKIPKDMTDEQRGVLKSTGIFCKDDEALKYVQNQVDAFNQSNVSKIIPKRLMSGLHGIDLFFKQGKTIAKGFDISDVLIEQKNLKLLENSKDDIQKVADVRGAVFSIRQELSERNVWRTFDMSLTNALGDAYHSSPDIHTIFNKGLNNFHNGLSWSERQDFSRFRKVLMTQITAENEGRTEDVQQLQRALDIYHASLFRDTEKLHKQAQTSLEKIEGDALIYLQTRLQNLRDLPTKAVQVAENLKQALRNFPEFDLFLRNNQIDTIFFKDGTDKNMIGYPDDWFEKRRRDIITAGTSHSFGSRGAEIDWEKTLQHYVETNRRGEPVLPNVLERLEAVEQAQQDLIDLNHGAGVSDDDAVFTVPAVAFALSKIPKLEQTYLAAVANNALADHFSPQRWRAGGNNTSDYSRIAQKGQFVAEDFDGIDTFNAAVDVVAKHLASTYKTAALRRKVEKALTRVGQESMRISLKTVEPAERDRIFEKMKASFDSTEHGSFGFKIRHAFQISDAAYYQTFKKLEAETKKDGNIVSYGYHSTNFSAATQIAKGGFMIPKTAQTGRMIGNGVYTTKVSSKSLQYVGASGFSRRKGSNGVLFLCKIAEGKSHQLSTNVFGSANTCNNLFSDKSADTIYVKKGIGGIKNDEACTHDPKRVIPVYWIDVELQDAGVMEKSKSILLGLRK